MWLEGLYDPTTNQLTVTVGMHSMYFSLGHQVPRVLSILVDLISLAGGDSHSQKIVSTAKDGNDEGHFAASFLRYREEKKKFDAAYVHQ